MLSKADETFVIVETLVCPFANFSQNKLFAPQKPTFPTISERTEIPDLIGERPVFFFQHFNLSIDDS